MNATDHDTDNTRDATDVVHLRRAGVSVVIRLGSGRLPQIVHWGADLGDLTAHQLEALVIAARPPMSHNLNDQVWDVSVLPEFEAGWVGRPGIEGSRGGRDWSPAFRAVTTRTSCPAS